MPSSKANSRPQTIVYSSALTNEQIPVESNLKSNFLMPSSEANSRPQTIVYSSALTNEQIPVLIAKPLIRLQLLSRMRPLAPACPEFTFIASNIC